MDFIGVGRFGIMIFRFLHGIGVCGALESFGLVGYRCTWTSVVWGVVCFLSRDIRAFGFLFFGLG